MQKSRLLIFAAFAALLGLAATAAQAVVVTRLTAQEAALHKGSTHLVVLTAADITETTVNTAQVIPVFAIDDKMGVELVYMKLVTPFEDASDATSIITAIEVGDGADPNHLLASTELNVNGTEIDAAFGIDIRQMYTTADNVDVTVLAPTTGDFLYLIDTGEVHLYFTLYDAR